MQVLVQPEYGVLIRRIINELLVGVSNITDEMIDIIIEDIAEQIGFSIKQLTYDLQHHMGFSAHYARLTATQIAPKPVFYALLISVRTADIASYMQTILTSQRHSLYAAEEVLARRRALYHRIAPEFNVYLFDQNIDDYNQGHFEDNAIQRAIDIASVMLPDHPNWYLDLLTRLLDICYGVDPDSPVELPQDLKVFSLLVSYIKHLQKANVPYEDIYDVLYTVSDVITHEHLAKLAYEAPADQRFRDYKDYVDFVTGTHSDGQFDPNYTVARAVLRGEGHLMVTANSYLHYRIGFQNNVILPTLSPMRSLRRIIQENPRLTSLFRLMAAVVRTGDDLGDIDIDRETHAPNVFLCNDEIRQLFLQLSGIGTGRFSSTLEKYLTDIFTTSHRDHDRIIEVFSNLECIAYWTMLDRVRPSDDLLILLRMIEAVILGSKVNAIYNDKIAEEIGSFLSQLS